MEAGRQCNSPRRACSIRSSDSSIGEETAATAAVKAALGKAEAVVAEPAVTAALGRTEAAAAAAAVAVVVGEQRQRQQKQR